MTTLRPSPTGYAWIAFWNLIAVGLVFMVLLPVAGFALAIVVVVVLAVGLLVLLSRIKLIVGDRELAIHNLLRTHRIPVRDITRVEVRNLYLGTGPRVYVVHRAIEGDPPIHLLRMVGTASFDRTSLARTGDLLHAAGIRYGSR